MPKSCVAVNCSNHNMMANDLTFHIFPNQQKFIERWARWVQACKRVNADGTKWELVGTQQQIRLPLFRTLHYK